MRVCQDTWELKKGEWFVAVKGENFDGHTFIKKALSKGAAGVLELPELFATAQQKLFEIKPTVIAITGSYGKTTTKEAVYQILRTSYPVYRTAGNLNTPLGIALDIVNNLRPRHRFLVIEMGMDRLGEIKESCEIVHPTVGVITNIGEMHLEKLGTQENIIRAKMELLQALPEGGTAFLNASDPNTLRAAKHFRHRKIWFGGSSHFLISPRDLKRISYPHFGSANQENILAAWAVGKYFGISPDKIQQALRSFVPPAGRLRIFSNKNGVKIIDDTYNAGPRSMREALSVLKNFSAKRRVAILGDMLELGRSENEFHQEVVRQAAKTADVFIPFGKRMRRAAKDLAVESHNLEIFFPHRGDAILVKGSRGMKMERVVKEIKEKRVDAFRI
ncbi:MAG: UDP-N-acetylmuramoyl-tripeptide--D-alanyl-D-alanine ligase [Patescibacteria group bacterium]